VIHDNGMTELAPGWEIVARETRAPLARMLLIVLQVLSLVPPEGHSSVTFTVRNRETGETRKVTANSSEEAAVLIAQGQFDEE
jgi:hypothetical protein